MYAVSASQTSSVIAIEIKICIRVCESLTVIGSQVQRLLLSLIFLIRLFLEEHLKALTV